MTCSLCHSEEINKEPFYWRCPQSSCVSYHICHFCIYEEPPKTLPKSVAKTGFFQPSSDFLIPDLEMDILP